MNLEEINKLIGLKQQELDGLQKLKVLQEQIDQLMPKLPKAPEMPYIPAPYYPTSWPYRIDPNYPWHPVVITCTTSSGTTTTLNQIHEQAKARMNEALAQANKSTFKNIRP